MVALLAVCALAVIGCGANHSQTRTDAAIEARVTARWRTGLALWGHTMLHALDRVSLLVATQEAVALLASPHSQVARALVPYERSLAGCAVQVRRLGPEPSVLGPARTYALHACAQLEQGEQLLQDAVLRLGRGGPDELDAAVGPLSAGQSELELATEALHVRVTHRAGSG